MAKLGKKVKGMSKKVPDMMEKVPDMMRTVRSKNRPTTGTTVPGMAGRM